MKIPVYCLAALALLIGGASCKKDNYKEPGSVLSGRIVYKGEAIGVENFQVPYQLYQFGFGKVGAINGTFAQDGGYSQVLFDGQYKLIIPNGQGPFKWKQLTSGAPDTTSITLNGNQTLDLEVTPYYMIRNAQVTGGSGKVTATFKAEKIITDAANAKDIERVTLYINNTQFVSGANNIGQSSTAGSAIADPNNISLNVTVPTSSQAYVYARIAIKISGVEDLIFSPVQKITYK